MELNILDLSLAVPGAKYLDYSLSNGDEYLAKLMKDKKIFLSYRRDDVPGYVARLEDDLERDFGSDRVFRDVEDIVGGSEWKAVIEKNLRESAALVLVIGKHWESIWKARENDPVNYVVLELERARELGVPVIPVFIQGAHLSPGLDLGPISWLRERQFYEISDTQKRWGHDVAGLVEILQQTAGLQPVKEPESRERKEEHGAWKSLFWGIAALFILAMGVWLAMTGDDGSEFDQEFTNEQNSQKVKDKATPSAQGENPESGSSKASTGNYPDIAGQWKNPKNGAVYRIRQFANGVLEISNKDKGRGQGKFIERMPRKFAFRIKGVGKGEFSVSNTGESMGGWFEKNGSNRKEFARLVRVK